MTTASETPPSPEPARAGFHVPAWVLAVVGGLLLVIVAFAIGHRVGRNDGPDDRVGRFGDGFGRRDGGHPLFWIIVLIVIALAITGVVLLVRSRRAGTAGRVRCKRERWHFERRAGPRRPLRPRRDRRSRVSEPASRAPQLSYERGGRAHHRASRPVRQCRNRRPARQHRRERRERSDRECGARRSDAPDRQERSHRSDRQRGAGRRDRQERIPRPQAEPRALRHARHGTAAAVGR